MTHTNKVVILAGGFGTRLSEETSVLPKPMLSVGDKPILHHIMDSYMEHGFNSFVVAAGYKCEQILAYFLKFMSVIDTPDGWLSGETLESGWNFKSDSFSVQVIDTGLKTQTGGRLKRLAPFLDDTFLMTYGDGLSNVNIGEEFKWHKSDRFYKKHKVTLTAVPPVPRFGTLRIEPKTRNVLQFGEKVYEGHNWINGGFMVIEPEVLGYIKDDQTNFEKDVLPVLAQEHTLYAHCHNGFWHCIDTKRDLDEINRIQKEEGERWLMQS